MTQDSWYRHPDFRKELAELLNHPTLKIALRLVEQAGLKPTPFPPGIDLMHFFGLMGAKRDGYLEALKNLTDLSEPKATLPPDRKPWTAIQPGPDGDQKSAP